MSKRLRSSVGTGQSLEHKTPPESEPSSLIQSLSSTSKHDGKLLRFRQRHVRRVPYWDILCPYVRCSSSFGVVGAWKLRCALDSLYGLVLHQSYHYYRVYATDAQWIKALVSSYRMVRMRGRGLELTCPLLQNNRSPSRCTSRIISFSSAYVNSAAAYSRPSLLDSTSTQGELYDQIDSACRAHAHTRLSYNYLVTNYSNPDL